MNTTATQSWKHIGVTCGSQPFLIDGVNVWSLDWRAADTHERAAVIDPVYGRALQFDVYRFAVGGHESEFAAGEFSNDVWGFYVPITQGAMPPALPPVGARPERCHDRESWRSVLPFVPAVVAVFSLPWIVLLIMINMGGQGVYLYNPNWKAWFLAESIAPAVVGLGIAVQSLSGARSWGVFAWMAYGLGCVGCALVISGMCVAG